MIQPDEPEQLPLRFAHVAAVGAEDFLVAPSNRLAVDWIERWPDWPGTALVLVGPPRSGKSHLAGIWLQKAGALLVDPGMLEVEETLAAARAGAALVDGLERIAGNVPAETALLRLYNTLREVGGTLLMTGMVAPSVMLFHLPDLASRLATAVVAEIAPPDDALLRAVSLKLFADRQLIVSEDVVEVLLRRGERSFGGLTSAIAAIDAFALRNGRAITPQLAREVVKGLLSPDPE